MTPPTYSPWWRPLEVLGRIGFGDGRPGGSPGLTGDPALRHDCRLDQAWRRFTRSRPLFEAWSPPPDSPWSAYAKPTLFAALPHGKDGQDAHPARPARLPAEQDLRDRAAVPARTAVVVDLHGALSVAYAAWLVRTAGLQPVPLFNNWPHPQGVVDAGRVLGALLYYVPWVLEDRELRGAGAPPVFLLDRGRLGARPPAANDFDNRYFHNDADFPSAATLRRHGVENLLYVRPERDGGRTVEAPRGLRTRTGRPTQADPGADAGRTAVGIASDAVRAGTTTADTGPEMDDLNAYLVQVRRHVNLDIARAADDAWRIGPAEPFRVERRKTPFSTTKDPKFHGFRRSAAGGFGRLIPEQQGGGFG